MSWSLGTLCPRQKKTLLVLRVFCLTSAENAFAEETSSLQDCLEMLCIWGDFETEIFKTKSNILSMQDLSFYWLALWWHTLKDFYRLCWLAVDFFICSQISDRNIWNMALNQGKLDERLVWRCRDPIMGMVRLCCQRWWDNHGETEQRLEGRVPVGDYPYCLPPLSRVRYPHTSSRRHIFS